MKLTEIFYHVDEFNKNFEKHLKNNTITDQTQAMIKRVPGRLSLSDIMTILVYFHHSGYRTFKRYYNDYVCVVLKDAFDALVSYNRFNELMRQALMPLTIFMALVRCGKSTGLGYIDSTPLKVCHNRRIYSHKVFKGLAQRGKTSTGWFYGFKLHFTISEFGEILGFTITPGNTPDNDQTVVSQVTKKMFGKLFGDKGYLSKTLFELLYSRGLTLMTRVRKNMKEKILTMKDKLLLGKRGVIESVGNLLKNTFQIEHSRHRSPTNFLVNLIAGLVAYSFANHKPSIYPRRKALAVIC